MLWCSVESTRSAVCEQYCINNDITNRQQAVSKVRSVKKILSLSMNKALLHTTLSSMYGSRAVFLSVKNVTPFSHQIFSIVSLCTSPVNPFYHALYIPSQKNKYPLPKDSFTYNNNWDMKFMQNKIVKKCHSICVYWHHKLNVYHKQPFLTKIIW